MKKFVLLAIALYCSHSFASVSLTAEARQATGLRGNQVFLSSHHTATLVADKTMSFTVSYSLCPQNKDCVFKSYPIKLFNGSSWHHEEDLQTSATYKRSGNYNLVATTKLTGDINETFVDGAPITIN